MVTNPPVNAGGMSASLGLGRSHLEEEVSAHSSTLAWRIPWTEEPGGLQSMRSQKAGHD